MTILHGDCREQLATLPDNSVDAIVTDPPYELGFMGKKWDASGIAYDPKVWGQCLRVLKPGGHLLAFGGTRTYHRMTVAIEDAGFEIRDSIHWLYGSGFPKSLNLTGDSTGWGTALKPAHEPIVLARKPLAGTVAANVMEYGTGALNIDATRISTTDRFGGGAKASSGFVNGYEHDGWTPGHTAGRWPANVILTHSPECADDCTPGCPVTILDRQSGDTGGASRYFATSEWDPEYDAPFLYVAKPSRRERNAGLDGMPERFAPTMGNGIGIKEHDPDTATPKANFHPTVKPVELIRYLIRLITPPDGTVLDPFLGSGTTAVAAILEGHPWICCELTADYLPIIEARVAWAEQNRPEPDLTLFPEQP